MATWHSVTRTAFRGTSQIIRLRSRLLLVVAALAVVTGVALRATAAAGVRSSTTRDGAFVFENGGLGVTNADGSPTRCLVSNAQWPVWSPDGSRILFTRNLPSQDIVLKTLRVADGSTTTVWHDVANPIGSTYSWSPNSRRIVFAPLHGPEGGFDLVVANARGRHRHALVLGSSSRAPRNPAWSPDGREIAFVDDEPAPPSPSDPTRSGWTSLFVVRPDGRGRRRLVQDIEDSAPVWSPTGNAIAYTRGVGPYAWNSEVWVANRDGTQPHPVGPALDGFNISAPVWSPDGNFLAVEGVDPSSPDQEDLFIIRPDRFDPQLVASGPGDLATPDLWAYVPDWVAWSPSGSTLATEFNGTGVSMVDVRSGDVRTVVARGGNARWDPRGRAAKVYHGVSGAVCRAPSAKGADR
jgi:Tol biopolymer transport system component